MKYLHNMILASAAVALMGSVAHAADFGGAYAGVDIAYSSVSAEPDDAKGVQGGMSLGYGAQVKDNWYVGGEVGIGYSTASGDDLEKKEYYSGTARVGYKANDTTMVYGLLGLETAKFETDKKSHLDLGYKIGLGAESFVSEKISVRGEVAYVDWLGKYNLPAENEIRATVGAAYHF